MGVLAHYNLASVAKVLSCDLSDDDVFNGVSIDTRTIKPGELFIALVGPNFDGHEYLREATAKGAVAAVVSHEVDGLSLKQLKVSDTRLALAEIAKARRKAFSGRVVGLTGSNGKTTVKELIAAILKRSGKVLATEGNFNNDIGLPLTMLNMQNDESFAVIEMGANHFGEIQFLSDIVRPDVALITNAGAAHLDGFGSIKGVAKAKSEIFLGLNENGTAVINADDEYASYWGNVAKDFQQIRFGIDAEDAEIKATDINLDTDHAEFVLNTPKASIQICLPIGGRHSISNVLAAAAVAYVLRIDIQEMKRGLESFLPVKGRLNFLKITDETLIIDDTYNANFDSTSAAIDVLACQQGKKILILGDMLESGESTIQLHADIGRLAKEKGIDELLAFGELSHAAAAAFDGKVKCFSEQEPLVNYVREKLFGKVSILVKGSRGMRMENIVNRLINSGDNI